MTQNQSPEFIEASAMPTKISYQKVEISHPEAKYFADLGGIQSELQIVLNLCAQAEKIDDASHDNGLLIDALGVAAIIRYMRCFHPTGKRKSLNVEDIGQLTNEENEVHNKIKLMRDKHIAHAVSHFEECYCEAYIEIEDEKRKPFHKILPGIERVILNKNNLWALKVLTNSVLEIVKSKMKEEEESLLKILNSLPEIKIADLKPHIPLNVNHDKIKNRH